MMHLKDCMILNLRKMKLKGFEFKLIPRDTKNSAKLEDEILNQYIFEIKLKYLYSRNTSANVLKILEIMRNSRCSYKKEFEN